MGNFNEILEKVKSTASEQFGNVSQLVQDKVPKFKDTVQESIPEIKTKLGDTFNFCKSKFIPKEDKAEIYALYTDQEDNLNKSEKIEENTLPFTRPLRSQGNLYGETPAINNNFPDNSTRIIDDKDYLVELIDLCNKNGEVPPYNDFNKNGWEHFYSADDPFFMWDKGQVIPNRIKVSNPHDLQKLEIYQGDMTPDLKVRHGFGILTTPSYVRIGQWRYGQFTGWGRESRRNGEVLEGRFTNGRVNGKGIFLTLKGNKYVGDFINNRLHGKGKFTTKNIQYSGEFVNNKMEGKGKIIFNNGHQYEGEFRDNEINGHGKFIWQNGDVYEGMMLKGKMNGFGKYTYASNGQIFEGNFVNGVKRGDGKITYPNGKIYEGKFVNGVPQGQGMIIENGRYIPIVFQNGKAYEYKID